MQIGYHMDSRAGLEWYRPTLAYIAIFVVVSAGGVAHILSDRLTFVTLAVTALAGGATAVAGYVRLLTLREQADGWIRGDRTRAVPFDVVAEREHELVSARHRHMLACGLRRVIDDAGRPWSPSARVPVDSVAVTLERDTLERVSAVLDDRQADVSPRCAALVESLLTDPASPLFSSSSRTGARRLSERLGQIRFELERGA